MTESKEGYSKENYAKSYFTPKNILIYIVVAIVVYGLVYYLFVAKKGGYSPNMYNTPTVTETPAVTQVPAVNPSVNTMTVDLAAENGFSEMGTATLTESNGKTKVDLLLTGYAANVSQPAHIHVGACPGVGAVKYPLANVVNGKSSTTLNVTLAQLKSELPLAVNVHESAAKNRSLCVLRRIKISQSTSLFPVKFSYIILIVCLNPAESLFLPLWLHFVGQLPSWFPV